MHPAPHRQFLISVALLGVLACAGPENQFEADSDDARAALIARAASFELDTEYVPPPRPGAPPLYIRLREDPVLGRVHHGSRPDGCRSKRGRLDESVR